METSCTLWYENTKRTRCSTVAISMYLILLCVPYTIKPDFIEQQESKLIWKVVKTQLGEMHNRQVYDVVDGVVNNICQKNDLDTASVHVFVSSSYEVNAFATVGGHLIVNRGLLRDCRNESELAGVLSHEIAHIQLHHLSSTFQIDLALTAISIMLSNGSKSDFLTHMLYQFVHNTIVRDKETEADDQAVRYLRKAGYNPKDMANFMRRMQSSGMLEFISDHPDSQKRAGMIEKKVAHSKIQNQNILSDYTWEKMKKEVQ